MWWLTEDGRARRPCSYTRVALVLSVGWVRCVLVFGIQRVVIGRVLSNELVRIRDVFDLTNAGIERRSLIDSAALKSLVPTTPKDLYLPVRQCTATKSQKNPRRAIMFLLEYMRTRDSREPLPNLSRSVI